MIPLLSGRPWLTTSWGSNVLFLWGQDGEASSVGGPTELSIETLILNKCLSFQHLGLMLPDLGDSKGVQGEGFAGNLWGGRHSWPGLAHGHGGHGD